MMKKLILVSFTGLSAMLAVAQGTYKPALSPEVGKRYAVITSITGNVTQEAMGQTMEIPMDSKNYNTLEVKGKAATGYQMASTVDRITFSSNIMGQDMRYDSDKKEDRDGKLGETMNGMVGGTTSFTVDAMGAVVQGSVVKPASTKEAEGGDMMESMMKSMGGSQNGPSPIFNLFPSAKEMKVGDSFIDSTVVNNDKDGKVKAVNTYKLAAIKDGFAQFDITGTTATERKAEMQGTEMMVITASKNTGSLLVNTATGLLEKRTMTIETTGNVEVQGMQIPITGKMVAETMVAPK